MSANNNTDLDVMNQFMNTTAEAHSAQDGVTAGVLVALAIVQPSFLPVVAAVFGLQKLTMKGILRNIDELLRVDEIRSNPEYFLVPFVLTSGVGALVLKYLTQVFPALF